MVKYYNVLFYLFFLKYIIIVYATISYPIFKGGNSAKQEI